MSAACNIGFRNELYIVHISMADNEIEGIQGKLRRSAREREKNHKNLDMAKYNFFIYRIFD